MHIKTFFPDGPLRFQENFKFRGSILDTFLKIIALKKEKCHLVRLVFLAGRMTDKNRNVLKNTQSLNSYAPQI